MQPSAAGGGAQPHAQVPSGTGLCTEHCAASANIHGQSAVTCAKANVCVLQAKPHPAPRMPSTKRHRPAEGVSTVFSKWVTHLPRCVSTYSHSVWMRIVHLLPDAAYRHQAALCNEDVHAKVVTCATHVCRCQRRSPRAEMDMALRRVPRLRPNQRSALALRSTRCTAGLAMHSHPEIPDHRPAISASCACAEIHRQEGAGLFIGMCA